MQVQGLRSACAVASTGFYAFDVCGFSVCDARVYANHRQVCGVGDGAELADVAGADGGRGVDHLEFPCIAVLQDRAAIVDRGSCGDEIGGVDVM